MQPNHWFFDGIKQIPFGRGATTEAACLHIVP